MIKIDVKRQKMAEGHVPRWLYFAKLSDDGELLAISSHSLTRKEALEKLMKRAEEEFRLFKQGEENLRKMFGGLKKKTANVKEEFKKLFDKADKNKKRLLKAHAQLKRELKTV